MLEPKKIVVDDMHFQLNPIPPMKALGLDKKVVTLLLPIIGAAKELSLDTTIDLTVASAGITKAFNEMDEVEFESFVTKMTANIVYLPEGKPAIAITLEVFNLIFEGKLLSIYKLLFEVMKYNKFTPFVMVEGGLGMNKIRSLLEPTKKQKVNGN